MYLLLGNRFGERRAPLFREYRWQRGRGIITHVLFAAKEAFKKLDRLPLQKILIHAPLPRRQMETRYLVALPPNHRLGVEEGGVTTAKTDPLLPGLLEPESLFLKQNLLILLRKITLHKD